MFANVLRLGGRFNAAKPLLCSRCGSFSRIFNRSKVVLIFFLCGGLKLLTLKINTLEIKLQISEKYL